MRNLLFLLLFSMFCLENFCQDSITNKRLTIKVVKPLESKEFRQASQDSFTTNELIIAEYAGEDCESEKPISARVGYSEGGNIYSQSLIMCAGLRCSCDKFQISSFEMTLNMRGVVHQLNSSNSRFTSAMIEAISKSPKGSKVYIEKINCLSPDGTTRRLPPLTFTLE